MGPPFCITMPPIVERLPSSATRRGAAAIADVLGMDADAGGVEQSTPLVPPHGVTAEAQIRGLVHDS